MRRYTLLLAPWALASIVLACNALSGVGDLVEVNEVTGREGGTEAGEAPDATVEDAFQKPDSHPPPIDATGTVIDASEAGLAEASAALCTGLTLVLRMDGTLTSSQGYTSFGPPSPGPVFVAGQIGQGVDLQGPTPYLQYGALQGATRVVSSSSGTVAMWAKTVDFRASNCPPSITNSSAYFFQVDSNGVLADCQDNADMAVWVGSGAASVGAGLSPAPWSDGQWNHVVATWSSSVPQMTFTVNGTLQSESAAWSPPDPDAIFITFGDILGRWLAFDDVAVWTRPLWPAEVLSVYQAGKNGKSVADLCP